jgi:hypothetical protein
MKMVVFDAAVKVTDILTNTAEETNWEDVTPYQHDKSGFFNDFVNVH